MNFPLAKENLPLEKYPDYRLIHKHISYVALLIFFAFFSYSYAQETPPLTNYPLSVYKAHNQNWAIDQTSNDIIYSANSDGLLEYDGASWKLYPLPNHQIVRSLLCDEISVNKSLEGKSLTIGSAVRQSRIYVGGYGEFGYWQENGNGQLKYFSLSKNSGFASLRTEEIWHILKTPEYIYFQSFSRIYRYDGKKLIEITASGNFMFLRYVRNRLLAQIIGQGLFELKEEKFVPLPGTEDLATSTVSAILPFSDDGILITTAKHGLFLWQNGEMHPWNIPLSEELKRNIVNKAILLKQDSSFAFGTIQKGGLYYFAKRESEIPF